MRSDNRPYRCVVCKNDVPALQAFKYQNQWICNQCTSGLKPEQKIALCHGTKSWKVIFDKPENKW